MVSADNAAVSTFTEAIVLVVFVVVVAADGG